MNADGGLIEESGGLGDGEKTYEKKSILLVDKYGWGCYDFRLCLAAMRWRVTKQQGR